MMLWIQSSVFAQRLQDTHPSQLDPCVLEPVPDPTLTSSSLAVDLVDGVMAVPSQQQDVRLSLSGRVLPSE